MSGKKAGSDGQIRNTTAAWAADTRTYPEGMRLMDTDTGVVRVSKGTTYALAWVPASGGATSSDGITDQSNYGTASVTAALNQAKQEISDNAANITTISEAITDEVEKLNTNGGGGNLTAAATTDLGDYPGDTVPLVGTTEITSFGTADYGVLRKVVCASATPITYNESTLIIPGSASIVTAPEDWFIAESYGGGVWHIVAYTRRDGSPLVSEVDNDLSASTTRAPSKSAVNTGLALKATKPAVTHINTSTVYDAAHTLVTCTASGGNVTYTLPASPVADTRLEFFNTGASDSDLRVDGGAKDIQRKAAATGDQLLSILPAEGAILHFSATADAWIVLAYQATV